MSFLSIFSSRPKLPSVPEVDASRFSEPENQFIQDTINDLNSNKKFVTNFTRTDGSKINIRYTGGELTINVYPNDGSRIEFTTINNYMGRRQWGGGITSYNPDGSLSQLGTGVYDRKFNTAADVFKYTIGQFETKLQEYNTRAKGSTKL